jgi:hypothetical protein
MTCECVLSCQLDHKSQQGSISVTIVWRETLDAKQKKAFVLEERAHIKVFTKRIQLHLIITLSRIFGSKGIITHSSFL